tara:strand:+ start:5002 stop:5250 length:249 start_codon:yes stop_codon:yes gene_type:complete
MATLIKSSGQHIDDYPSDTLEQMQKAVGGYIEPVYTNNKVVVVDEEGLLKNLPLNIEVSALVGKMIVGNAIVFTHKEWRDRN